MNVTRLALHLPDLAGFVPRHVGATPMAAGFSRASKSVQQAIVQEVIETLGPYWVNGRPQIPFKSHLIMCR